MVAALPSFYQVFTELYRVLPSFTGFYRVFFLSVAKTGATLVFRFELPDSDLVLPSFTEFYFLCAPIGTTSNALGSSQFSAVFFSFFGAIF